MKNIGLENIVLDGDLYHRIRMNHTRFYGTEYTPEKVFRPHTEYDWPGDMEGRALLAMVLTSRALHREHPYIEKIMEKLPQHLNEKGYFGEVLPDGTFDEQQLSGNNWFLRGLLEYYLWKKDEKVRERIYTLIQNLVMPLKGKVSGYPSKPEQRVYEGGVSGTVAGNVRNWRLSTDIGCAFIMLDGITQAYQVFKLEGLKDLIDEMIREFASMDIVALSFQTHATLSATRAFLRYYETDGDRWVLELAQRIYSTYLREAVTENYSNYNWFNRPLWTEPCAQIDSFIVAFGLWNSTGDAAYLEDAHHIFYNAIGYGQRPNGGFGCDECAGARDEFLMPKKEIFEAYFCCSMRGGEGLSKAAGFTYGLEGESLILPFYHSSTAEIAFPDGKVHISQKSGYPAEGFTRLDVL